MPKAIRTHFLVLLLATAPVFAPAARAGEPNPLDGVRLFVDHESPSWLQWEAYRRAGQADKADLIWRIAREPKSLWLGRFTRPNFAVKVQPDQSYYLPGQNAEVKVSADYLFGRPVSRGQVRVVREVERE